VTTTVLAPEFAIVAEPATTVPLLGFALAECNKPKQAATHAQTTDARHADANNLRRELAAIGNCSVCRSSSPSLSIPPVTLCMFPHTNSFMCLNTVIAQI
jgi:hypothetical protein